MMLRQRNIRNPRFLLAYPPLQFQDIAEESIRPDSSLAIPYLHAALTRAGFEADILDMTVGHPEKDPLEDTFYNREPLTHIAEDMIRIGMRPDRIVEEVADYDVIGITSIFTQQTSRCFEVAQLIKSVYPEKILVAGGVNARALQQHFFDHGFDAIFLSEAEFPIVRFAQFLNDGTPSLGDIPSIAFREDGRTVTNPTNFLIKDLDEYAMPSWARLPNDRYWDISEPWGGKDGWLEGRKPRFASILTSRGCPFRCTYCHISKEKDDPEAGDIGSLRLHSTERVEEEFAVLADLGVDVVYINDDSFLAKKKRVHKILDLLDRYEFTLADVNGVNIIHLFKREAGRLVVDIELLEHLYRAGFRRIGLPFESGSQRLVNKYSSTKWNMESVDVFELLRIMNEMGFTTNGNFMVGYPDETEEELTKTFLLAAKALDAGLDACGFFIVQPFPGTQMFDEGIAKGSLPKDWHWDKMGFPKDSPFLDLKIGTDTLSYARGAMSRVLNKRWS